MLGEPLLTARMSDVSLPSGPWEVSPRAGGGGGLWRLAEQTAFPPSGPAGSCRTSWRARSRPSVTRTG